MRLRCVRSVTVVDALGHAAVPADELDAHETFGVLGGVLARLHAAVHLLRSDRKLVIFRSAAVTIY